MGLYGRLAKSAPVAADGPVLRIQTHHPHHCGGWSNPATFSPRGGGYHSVRHLQVSLRWRWRNRTRPGALSPMRIEVTPHGLDIWEREDVAACTRQSVTWHPSVAAAVREVAQ
jgi:hypothetical protein